MATITVSTSSGLTSALRSAASGDVITLASGHYTLDASGISKALTITSDGSAVFDSVNLSRMSNLTIDGVDFNGTDGEKNAFRVWGSDNITFRNGDMEGVANGYGLGRGLLVQNATDFTLENMTMHGFSTGVFIDGVDGITLRNNHLIDLAWDGIIGGGIHHAVFSGNVISLDIPSGRLHSDGFQFWNVGANQPSTDMLIENNVIRAHNNQSHGIYMANAIANNGGGAGSFFQEVVIRDNTIVSGDGLGLSWGQTDGLDIHGNIVLKDPTLPADRTAPIIRVHYNATDVSITGNVTHKAPAAADANWQPHVTSGAWTIADNPIIRIGATLAEAQALLDSANAAVRLAAKASALSDMDDNGRADTFRLDASGKTDVVRGLDFGERDQIVLHDFAAGSFRGAGSGASADGTSATIGSLDDLRALDRASSAVSVRENGHDTLIIDIQQSAAHHTVQVLGLAHEYF